MPPHQLLLNRVSDQNSNGICTWLDDAEILTANGHEICFVVCLRLTNLCCSMISTVLPLTDADSDFRYKLSAEVELRTAMHFADCENNKLIATTQYILAVAKRML